MIKNFLKSSGKILTLSILAIIVIGGFFYGYRINKEEIDIRIDYEQTGEERKAFYTNMSQTIASKSQIALRNDSSFRNNVELIMAGRKDAEGTMMKWIQETNPNANFSEVSAIYKDLSRTIEAKRDQFFEQERKMQHFNNRHKKLLRDPITGFILKTILGKEELGYKSISSNATEKTFTTGVEDDVKLF